MSLKNISTSAVATMSSVRCTVTSRNADDVTMLFFLHLRMSASISFSALDNFLLCDVIDFRPWFKM